MKKLSNNILIFLLCSIIVNGFLLWFFHDYSLWPQDEGVFAHVAERMLDGEVLNKDVEEVHPGYNNFVNAASLALFGRNFVSLRYPLVVMGILQAILIFLLFSSRGGLFSFTASLLPATLGILHFINPNHHWYCLFLVIILGCSLTWMDSTRKRNLIWFGFLIVSIYLFRQLSGVYAGMGTMAYLFLTHKDEGGSSFLSRLFVGVLFIGTFLYVVKMSDVLGFFLFGIWPLLIFAYLIFHSRVNSKYFTRMIARLGIGAILGVIPLVGYHVFHGSFFMWIDDTIFRAFTVVQQSFLSQHHMGQFLVGASHLLSNPINWAYLLNGMYWLILPIIPALCGFDTTFGIFRRSRKKNHPEAIAILAVFYALIPLHYQNMTYLYFIVSLSLLGLLSMVKPQDKILKWPSIVLTLGIVLVALHYHVAQSPFRGISGALRGERLRFYSTKEHFHRMDLKVDKYTLALYKELITIVEENTAPTDTIFAVPNNAEIYFLSNRKNPFRFFSTDHGLQTREDLNQLIQTLKDSPPRLVIFDVDNKRNTRFSLEAMAYVREHYKRIAQVASFFIYEHI